MPNTYCLFDTLGGAFRPSYYRERTFYSALNFRHPVTSMRVGMSTETQGVSNSQSNF